MPSRVRPRADVGAAFRGATPFLAACGAVVLACAATDSASPCGLFDAGPWEPGTPQVAQSLANSTSHAFTDRWGAQFTPPSCEAIYIEANGACLQFVDPDGTDKDGSNFKVRAVGSHERCGCGAAGSTSVRAHAEAPAQRAVHSTLACPRAHPARWPRPGVDQPDLHVPGQELHCRSAHALHT